MKLTIDQADLARVLTAATKVVPSRTTIPILGNILLRAEDDKLHVRGTDLDMEVSDAAPADVDAPGETTVDAARLAAIVKRLPSGGSVSLELVDGDVTVKSGRSRFKLRTLPAGDFPSLDVGALSTPATVDLAALFAPVSFAISTEETRYYLNGIYLDVVQDGDFKLRAVATDGHKLGMNDIPLPDGIEDSIGIIVPRAAVGLIPKGEVEFSYSKTKVRVQQGDYVLVSKLIDGTFPDYARVIPQGNDKSLMVDKAAWIAAVDRVSTISTERGRAVKLSFADGVATMSATNVDAGTAQDEIEVEWPYGEFSIGMNAAYLRETLGVFDADEVATEFGDPGSPVLFRGGSVLALVMPMRV